MAIKMSMPSASIESTPIDIPNGLADLKLTNIGATKQKNVVKYNPGDPVNYVFYFEIAGIVKESGAVEPLTKEDGSAITIRMYVSSKAPWIQNDICHGLGLPMEDDGTSVSIPGEFDGPADKPEDWQYRGPLVGRVMRANLEKQDKYSNVKTIVCAISDCATRFPKVQHSKDLLKKK